MENQSQFRLNNICLLTDSYKIGHWNMYPADTEYVYSYFESRTGALFNNTVFTGLQPLLMKYLSGSVVDYDKLYKAKYLMDRHIAPDTINYKGWKYIIDEHNGKLPLKIKAVPEGTPIPTGNVLMTVENTDPECGWLTNDVETLLTHVWYPSTVASLSRECKLMFKDYLKWTSSESSMLNHLPFMLHDFGFRGVSSLESAASGGFAHLINFKGTDTIPSLMFANDYYNAKGVAGYSVNATEHSIMTALGEKGEFEVLKSLIRNYPSGILSIVIDSYNYERFLDVYVRNLKEEILNRDGKTVFRPDSEEPVSTSLRVIELLDSIFGVEYNSKGYNDLNPKIGMLWGDGIDYLGIRNILHAFMQRGYAASNIIFGMGGGLLQKVNRDTQRFAFKSSAQCRSGVWHDVYKKPRDMTKMSKRGRLGLYKVRGSHGSILKTMKEDPKLEEFNLLETVFENGNITKLYEYEDVVRNAA